MELTRSSISSSEHEYVVNGVSAKLITLSYSHLCSRHGFEYDLLEYDIGIKTSEENKDQWHVLFMPKYFIDGDPGPGEEWMYMTFLDVPEQTFVYEKSTLELVEMYGGR